MLLSIRCCCLDPLLLFVINRIVWMVPIDFTGNNQYARCSVEPGVVDGALQVRIGTVEKSMDNNTGCIDSFADFVSVDLGRNVYLGSLKAEVGQ